MFHTILDSNCIFAVESIYFEKRSTFSSLQVELQMKKKLVTPLVNILFS